MFFDAIDGRKVFDYGWSDAQDGRGGSSFVDGQGSLIEPGDHVLVLTREPTRPAGFPDLHLHVTTRSSTVTCDGSGCRAPGSTPPVEQTATVLGTLQSSSSVDGQAILLASVDVILHSTTGSTARDRETTSAGDGSSSFDGVSLGSYALLVDGSILQSVQVDNGGTVDLGAFVD